MRKSSQKQTEHGKLLSQVVSTKNSWVKKDSSVNRFVGMSKDLERVPPLHIPGYKTRG